MSKFKVGDRVKIVIGFGFDGRMGFVTDALPHGALVASDTSIEKHTESEDGRDFHYFFANNQIEPMPNNTIQLNHQYSSKNGQKWECIAIRGEVAWLSVVDGDDAYRFKLDGTNLSYGFGAWDINWEPVVEWRTNTAHLCDDGGSYHMGAGESGSYSGGVTVTIKYPVVDGKPDFTQATVTPASDG